MEQEQNDNDMENTVKMVVCDLDGTLLYNTKKITEYTKQTIRELRENGILFGICSGRSAIALQHMVKVWGIEKDVDFILGFNGGMYCDPKSGHTEECLKLSKDDIPAIERSFHGFPFTFAEYEGKEMQATARNALTGQMARRNQLGFRKVKGSELYRDTCKYMAVAMPWVIDRYLESGRQDDVKGCRMFRSGPFLLEIIHPDLSKLTGVKNAAGKFNIQLDEIVSFGNDNNDLEMLSGTIGVAMKNALPVIKDASKYVTEYSNKEDGVAKFIQEEILEPLRRSKEEQKQETETKSETKPEQ